MNLKKIKLPSILEEFLHYLTSVQGRAAGTVNGYCSDLILFLRYIKKEKISSLSNVAIDYITIADINKEFINSITIENIHNFIKYLDTTKDNKNTTRSRKITSIRVFYKYLLNIGTIDTNITEDLKTPKKTKTMPVYLSEYEANNLLNIIDYSHTVNRERDYCIYTLLLNLGLRISELLNIKFKDIHNDSIKILGKGNKERIVFLNEVSKQSIDQYLKVRNKKWSSDLEDYLFISTRGTKLSPRTVQLSIKKYCSMANINEDCTPHKLRHTMATLLLKNGTDVRTLQRILDHESLNTVSIYTHVNDEDVRRAIEGNQLNRR